MIRPRSQLSVRARAPCSPRVCANSVRQASRLTLHAFSSRRSPRIRVAPCAPSRRRKRWTAATRHAWHAWPGSPHGSHRRQRRWNDWSSHNGGVPSRTSRVRWRLPSHSPYARRTILRRSSSSPTRSRTADTTRRPRVCSIGSSTPRGVLNRACHAYGVRLTQAWSPHDWRRIPRRRPCARLVPGPPRTHTRRTRGGYLRLRLRATVVTPRQCWQTRAFRACSALCQTGRPSAAPYCSCARSNSTVRLRCCAQRRRTAFHRCVSQRCGGAP